MPEATLSSKNQIVVPREAREALGIKAGDKILIVVRNATVIMMPKPSNYPAAVRGLGRGSYPHKYLRTERESWD